MLRLAHTMLQTKGFLFVAVRPVAIFDLSYLLTRPISTAPAALCPQLALLDPRALPGLDDGGRL